MSTHPFILHCEKWTDSAVLGAVKENSRRSLVGRCRFDNAEEAGMKYLGRDDVAAKYIPCVHADQQRRRNR